MTAALPFAAIPSIDPEQLRKSSDVPLSRAMAAEFVELEPVICACFAVGLNTIREALASGRVHDIADIGTVKVKLRRRGRRCI